MEDNTKKYVRWAVAGVLAIAAVAAFLLQRQINASIMTSMAVQVPEIVATAINIGIIALLTAGFTWVFTTLGVDLRGVVPALSLLISAWIVGQLQGIVDVIPASFDPYINALFYLLTIILAPAGALYLANKNRAPANNNNNLI